jgi:hypothetical protein
VAILMKAKSANLFPFFKFLVPSREDIFYLNILGDNLQVLLDQWPLGMKQAVLFEEK